MDGEKEEERLTAMCIWHCQPLLIYIKTPLNDSGTVIVLQAETGTTDVYVYACTYSCALAHGWRVNMCMYIHIDK